MENLQSKQASWRTTDSPSYFLSDVRINDMKGLPLVLIRCKYREIKSMKN